MYSRCTPACIAVERDKYGVGVIDQFYKMWDGDFLGLNGDATIPPYAVCARRGVGVCVNVCVCVCVCACECVRVRVWVWVCV